MEPKQEEKKGNNKLLLALLGLLLIGNTIFIWLWLQERGRANTVVIEKQDVLIQRDSVKADLLDLQKSYATLQTDDKALNSNLDVQRAKIDSLLQQAEKHKGDAYMISKLKKETQTLRDIMKHFVIEIDSLNTYAKQVVAEKDKVTIAQ